MATSNTKSVEAYLQELPPERRRALEAVRSVIRKNLPRGMEEILQFGMISYCIPLSRYPTTYNGKPLMVAALASQKQYMSVYLMSVYADSEQLKSFQAAYRRSGKRLDMGKSCVRFKTLEDLPLPLIGEVMGRIGVDEFIARYEALRPSKPARPRDQSKPVQSLQQHALRLGAGRGGRGGGI